MHDGRQQLPRHVIHYEVPQLLMVQIGPPRSGYSCVRKATDIPMNAIWTETVVDAIQEPGPIAGRTVAARQGNGTGSVPRVSRLTLRCQTTQTHSGSNCDTDAGPRHPGS